MKTLKLLTSCFAMLGIATFTLQAQTIVNFSVDMSFQHQISTEGVFLAGSFNGWSDAPMEDPDGDGIFTSSLTLQPGTYQFKFKNGPDGWENIVVNHPDLPNNCVTGMYKDRFVEVGGTAMDYGPVCFNYCVDCSGLGKDFAGPVVNPFAPELTPSESMAFPTLVDIDGDDDLDMFISHREFFSSCWEVSAFDFYENEGTVENPEFVKIPGETFGLPPLTSVVTFVDIDADGDQDAFISDHCFQATINFYENTGSATQPQFNSTPSQTMETITGIGFAMLAFGDLDGDGDYDALINGYRPPQFVYLENTGTPSSFAYTTPEINPFGLSIPLFSSSEWAQFTDWDCDGDLDILNSHWQGTNHEEWMLYLHENNGSATNPAFLPMEAVSYQFILAMTLGDMDGDGDQDIFSDEYYFKNVSTNGCVINVIPRDDGKRISISPNPTTGYIEITGLEAEPTFLTITDALGRVVLEREMNGDGSVDLSSVPKGMYFVGVQGVCMEKIIVQ